ncbi:PAS domain S-box protein [Flavobacterium zepuense]|uniref:histidine kinase n=1 Tax=Flavobacterium zepuense TaxID=2593302 RepID=A0A552V9M8_9FLAO|nr:ATP-binding protein [Flavobacterium zepuense]TRW27174.1 PAS domain S-box protein [Flavobacterium zepuense]
MKDVVSIRLDNEMDLILAHKRAMKLSELCGLITSLQTRFATAVSEIARCSIAYGKNSYVVLGINFLSGGKKELKAVIYDDVNLAECNPEAYAYAVRLSKSVSTELINGVYQIHLTLPVPYSGVITESRITSFIEYFQRETPLSPYDELRKKNIQLIELSEKLSESESNYKQLTDTIPMIVFSVSGSGVITLANKRLEQILGRNFTAFNAANLEKIFHIEESQAIIKGWEAVQKRKVQFTSQARLRVKESYVWYMVSIMPNTDDRGDISGYIISMFDINAQKIIEETLKDNRELKATQENLKASNKELSAKNRELEQFAYIASHDLQEPLRKIRNFTSLAERNLTQDDKEKLYFPKINAAAERMSRLIKDVLNYSRLTVETDMFVLVDLNEILNDVINDFEFLIKEKQAKIETENLPVIKGIPVQISQLFYNIIGNSLKFVNLQPSIKIASEIVDVSNKEVAGTYYKISISDNGIGIEQQHIDKLFIIFKRLHPQNVYEGTGIGLALCKKIVQNHGGFMEIESEPGRGTKVSAYLPLS